jgi:hypothetical protein
VPHFRIRIRKKKLKTEGIDCNNAKKYGGLYYFYPQFIADWTETVRKYNDGLRLTFSGKASLVPQSPGCPPQKIGGAAFVLQINAVAANCVQVKPVKKGKVLKVSATVTNPTELESLHLSFNGCVVRPIPRKKSSTQFLKIWEYPQLGTAALTGCKAPPKDTWLLVFSNVNHVADTSKAVIPSIAIETIGGKGTKTGSP